MQLIFFFFGRDTNLAGIRFQQKQLMNLQKMMLKKTICSTWHGKIITCCMEDFREITEGEQTHTLSLEFGRIYSLCRNMDTKSSSPLCPGLNQLVKFPHIKGTYDLTLVFSKLSNQLKILSCFSLSVSSFFHCSHYLTR